MDNQVRAQEWQRLAEQDLMRPAPMEIVCYLCQQSAE